MTGSACTEGHRLNKRKLAAWAAIVLTILARVFLPEVVSVGWHLIHGNFARFHEWEVPVPWGWRSFTAEDTLIVQRMHRFYFRHNAFSQVMVGVLPVSAQGTYDYEKQKRSLVEHAGKEGYQFIGEHRIRLEVQDGYCISFLTIRSARRMWITCDVPELRLTVDFIGDQTYASTLDSIIERIKTR